MVIRESRTRELLTCLATHDNASCSQNAWESSLWRFYCWERSRSERYGTAQVLSFCTTVIQKGNFSECWKCAVKKCLQSLQPIFKFHRCRSCDMLYNIHNCANVQYLRAEKLPKALIARKLSSVQCNYFDDTSEIKKSYTAHVIYITSVDKHHYLDIPMIFFEISGRFLLMP